LTKLGHGPDSSSSSSGVDAFFSSVMATPFQRFLDFQSGDYRFHVLAYISELMFDRTLENTTVDRE
jgi:hypothetical protein